MSEPVITSSGVVRAAGEDRVNQVQHRTRMFLGKIGMINAPYNVKQFGIRTMRLIGG